MARRGRQDITFGYARLSRRVGDAHVKGTAGQLAASARHQLKPGVAGASVVELAGGTRTSDGAGSAQDLQR